MRDHPSFKQAFKSVSYGYLYLAGLCLGGAIVIGETMLPMPLDAAKEGNLPLPTTEVLRPVVGTKKEYCLIEDPAVRLYYGFRKSESKWSLTDKWSQASQHVTILGSIPQVSTLAMSCDEVQVSGHKWSSAEGYYAAIQGEVDAMRAVLKPLADDPTASRYSSVIAWTAPSAP